MGNICKTAVGHLDLFCELMMKGSDRSLKKKQFANIDANPNVANFASYDWVT